MAVLFMIKKCTLCGLEKPISEFYKAPACKDGHAGQCTPCVKARARIRHFVKREEIRAYDRKRSKLPHRVLSRARALQKEREHDPQRHIARNAVNNAVRDGRLLKMDCAFCGSSNTVAHHHDYNLPLDVTWLCTPCHTRFHALEEMGRRASSIT
jgi:ribosomal protein S27AE